MFTVVKVHSFLLFGIAGCVSVENQEKNMTHVCVGKNKSVGEGEKKKMVGKSFWGRVHTRVGEKDGEHHTRFCCVSHRETQCSLLSGFFLLIQHTRRYFVKFFLFPKVFSFSFCFVCV